MANLKDIGYGVGKYLEVSDASGIPDIGTNRTNIDLLNFKVATNNAYALYNFKDGMIDAYQTEAGVDASGSTNEAYDSSGDYYKGMAAGVVTFSNHTSTGAGTWTCPVGVTTAEILVVAGGGGGGQRMGGGGGAGGVVHHATYTTVPGVVYDLTVGAGGSGGGGGGSGGVGSVGGNSSFNDNNEGSQSKMTANGGGGGAKYSGGSASAGGSGGGGTYSATGAGSGNQGNSGGGTGYGNNGGDGGSGTSFASGSGGGAGAAGGQGGSGNGPAGGVGREFSNFSSYGASGFFAGGGGSGGHGTSNSSGAGGNGGGGAGVVNGNATSGSANTGGGGGGVRNTGDSAGYSGGTGGTGTVIIRYQPSTEGANITLVSNAQTAQAVPTTGRLMIYEEASTGTITLDTDIKGYVSRDNGTTYTQTPLTLDTTYETGKRLVSGSVDISGQPSGTNMRYKIETLNQSGTKVCRLHGASLLWS